MAEESTLDLDFDWERSGEGRRRVARVMLSSASGFTRDGGAPTLTRACSTRVAFERELTRLTAELAALRERGIAELEGRAPVPHAEPAPPEPAGPARAGHLDTELLARDVMTREVKTLRRNDLISMADELMKVGRFRHVVVLDEDDQVAGVISQRDIFYGALAWTVGQSRSAHDRALEAYPVKNVMQTNVVSVDPETRLRDVASLMIERKIGCVPVVEGNQLVGILTEGDFLSLLATERQAAS